MKITFLLLGLLTTACTLQAAPAVDWISDSHNSFDVTLTGIGEGWSGTITSPSGLWQLASRNIIDYPVYGQNSPQVFIDNTAVATYLGSLSPQFTVPNPSAPAPFDVASLGTYGGYRDYFNPGEPINDKNSLVYGYLAGLDWEGMSTISVTSMPNLNNASCWAWTANYSACGENLAAPEPNPVSIFALAAMLSVASAFRKKLKLSRRAATRQACG